MKQDNYFYLLITSVMFASISQLLLKKSAIRTYENTLNEYLNAYVITAYIMFFISSIFTVISLQKITYKNLPIIESLGYVFILILSKVFLNEKITLKKFLGNLLIIVGIIMFYLN